MKPALSAEEWALALEHGGVCFQGGEPHIACAGPFVRGGPPVIPDVQLSDHATAALLLHGYFTREFVEKLRGLESESHHPASSPYFGDVSWLLDLANLIDDLLPPEGP